MFPAQLSQTDPGELLRCRDSSQLMGEEQKGRTENTKADETLAYEVDHALWKDTIFRAIDYDNIDVRVSNGVVHLYGHVSSLTNEHRAENAIQGIDGILNINNHLVPDDRLVTEVATALGQLESTYDCKFSTGVSHGVVLLSGNVDNPNIKLLAEKCAANDPNVRGVINSVRSPGGGLDLQQEPFLQPSIGAEIFFLDGLSGKVKQVIINPDNRLVVAMVIQGRFVYQRQDLKSLNNGEVQSSERSLVIPMRAVRYLTTVSGFLNIHSKQGDGYMDFDPAHFLSPEMDWKAPYPYCPEDILFPIKGQIEDIQIAYEPQQFPFAEKPKGSSFKKRFFVNDSCGG